jgi:septal ring factor EnvC (AmiA/AmiB activator)
LEEQSTNEVTVVSVKPTASNVDKEQVAEPDKAKAPVPVSKDSKDVASSRPKTSVDKVDTKPMKSELDNKSKENRMDEKELNALKASLEDMTKKNQDLEKKNKDLTATVESNAIEVKKLNDQLAITKVEITKDYAKLVAHYRIVLDKPDTKGLDSDETKKAYIDSLGKRTLESLKDSLDDITLEFKSKTSATADKTVDTSKEKLPSPALHNDTAAGKEKSKLDTIFDGE